MPANACREANWPAPGGYHRTQVRPPENRAPKKPLLAAEAFGEIAALVIADAQAKTTNEKVKYQWARHLVAFRP